MTGWRIRKGGNTALNRVINIFPNILGSGERIRTSGLQVMSSLPKIGALDRQAGVPRVALRFSTTRNPASTSFNYPTRGE